MKKEIVMKEMIQRVAMTLAVLMLTASGAWAQNTSITYIERSWDNDQKKVVETEKTISDYEILAGLENPDAWARMGAPDNATEEQQAKDYYFVVTGDVTYKTIKVYGKVHLILCDGAKLTCWGGIIVDDNDYNAKLSIYGQAGDTGELIVTNCYHSAAGIGSVRDGWCGEITIHGGNLNITGGKSAAGIGGGALSYKAPGSQAGTTTIYGGHVTAQGGDWGAGIGAGLMARGGTLDIYGGEVTATGGSYAAGVGGGGSKPADSEGYGSEGGGACGFVCVYGGKLTAQGGKKGAGIGTGQEASTASQVGYNGELRVYEGATVIATGGKYGAGIGGGANSFGITARIYGGTVTAKGGVDGAGIGSGELGNLFSTSGKSCVTYISGGTVRAEGSSYGAGIGGGEYGRGGDIYITGGTVIAIAGEDCKGRDDKCGSAIGAGDGVSNKDTDKKAYVLEIGTNMKVTGGDAENNIERVFTSYERNPACRWRNYVKIEPCSHETPTVGSDRNTAITYSIDEELHHTQHCRYCNYTLQEGHELEDFPCGIANGTYQFTVYEPGSTKNTYVQGTTKTVGAGEKFYLPECTNVPAGYIFKGWEMNPAPDDVNRWAAVKGGDPDRDINYPAGTSVEALLGQDQTTTFYARFLYDLGWETIWDYNSPTTGTQVHISHPDITPWSFTPGNYETGSLTIDFEDLTDANNQVFGTHYVARATYILNDYEYTYDNVKDVLSLSDDADNNAALSAVHSHTADITLAGRTLYQDGAWNTLCLPFNIADISSSPLAGSTLKELTGAAFDEGTGALTLNFTTATSIEAGKPYLIKWESGSHIVSPLFTAITVREDLKDDAISTDGEGDKTITFLGTYKKMEFAEDKPDILFLGADNTLYYPKAGASIGAQRGYFQLSGITAGDLSSGARVRSFVLNFGDSEEVTGIIGQPIVADQSTVTSATGWYTLDGRKLTGKPTQKGIYINNGKLVAIK